MEIQSKIFLVNILALISVASIDRLFNDVLEKIPVIGDALCLWAAFTIFSLPVWFGWIICTS